MLKKTLSALVAWSLVSGASLAGDLALSSTDIAEGAQLQNKFVFKGFGCDGENQSPQLSWTNAPAGTKSFVVTAYDPDAPTGSGWWHWVAFNIPANVNSLATNASRNMPKPAVQAKNDFGIYHYGGACPPAGEVHRYQFTVHALNVEKLDLNQDSSPALVGFMTHVHSIDSAKITAVYNR